MSDEFRVHRLNAQGFAAADKIAELYTKFLDDLKALVPPGRERSLMITKAQESSYWAKRGIAVLPENQMPAEPVTPDAPVDLSTSGEI